MAQRQRENNCLVASSKGCPVMIFLVNVSNCLILLVDGNISLTELLLIGFDDSTFSWFKSYLSGKCQTDGFK